MPSAADLDAVRERVDAARATFHGGHPNRAARQYDSLRRRLETSYVDRPDLGYEYARVLFGLAASTFEVSGDLERAMRLLADAERVATSQDAPELAASIRGQRGLLLLRAGRTDQALRALDAAVELMDSARPNDQMIILLNRGTLNMERGSVTTACADFDRCAQVAADEGDVALELRARHNLGYAAFLAGQIPRALALMDRAEALNDGPAHPIGLLDRARVLREAGLTADAERLLAEAADLFAAGRLHQDVGETQLARAECALVEGESARARRLAREAERLFARRDNQRWQRRAQLLVLQCERRELTTEPGSRVTSLRRLAARAQALEGDCRAEGRRDLARSARLLALECTLRAGGEPDEVPKVSPADPLEDRLHTREVRALVALRRGRHAQAATEVRRGLAELGSHANRFGSLDLRTAAAVHSVPLARIGLEVAERTGSATEFFAAVERGRAISIRLARVAPPSDERTADLLTSLRRTAEEVRDLEGDPTASAELARLRQRTADLQRDIRARAWELEGGGEAGRESARLTEVRTAARTHGTAFATYVVHRGRWVAVLASSRRPELVDLAPGEEVDELVHRSRADLDALAMPHLPPAIQDAVRRSLDATLGRLDELLLAPLGVAGLPLVVSCSANLGLLPWTLLPSRGGLPLVVTPSATAWLRSAGHPRPARLRVASVAGPGLHRAEDEARRVQASWPGAELYVGADATTRALRSALATSDVVHVAAHGNHHQDSPLFSSLRVVDGPLYAYELDAGDRPAPCVVLSACEAGLATVRPGDEGLGLTSVLLHLGSRSVLAGTARVRDDVAARVMEDVHRAMAGGTSSAAALAQALAHEDVPAPFVAFGADW